MSSEDYTEIVLHVTQMGQKLFADGNLTWISAHPESRFTTIDPNPYYMRVTLDKGFSALSDYKALLTYLPFLAKDEVKVAAQEMTNDKFNEYLDKLFESDDELIDAVEAYALSQVRPGY